MYRKKFQEKKFTEKNLWEIFQKKNLKFCISKFFGRLKSKFENVYALNCWQIFSKCSYRAKNDENQKRSF